MITNHDRSGWFGASDTYNIMGNWCTKTFFDFWLEKLGVKSNTFASPAMLAGTHYEHRILDKIGVVRMDRQIKKRSLRLRVNLDGETDSCIFEVKTHKSNKFTLSKRYWQQCQVQMWVAKKACQIVAYRLLPEDYRNFFNPIDSERLTFHPIPYDKNWIEKEYLPRLRILAESLRKGCFPQKVIE